VSYIHKEIDLTKEGKMKKETGEVNYKTFKEYLDNI
jgi:hypothetical protein